LRDHGEVQLLHFIAVRRMRLDRGALACYWSDECAPNAFGVDCKSFCALERFTMRITAGHVRGLRLKTPRDMSIRPTPDMLKQAIYSSLGAFVVGARTLDLFSGSGSLGLDALSRGAASVTFVEAAASSVKLLEQNIALVTKAMDNAAAVSVIRGDVFEWLERNAGRIVPFDLIVADPPYAQDTLPESSVARKLLQTASLPSILRADGWLVIHHSKREQMPENGAWRFDRRLAHGDSMASFFQKRIS
jgi:16S rRNA (guanine(966)-N(2))-methyltransferase RsmD